VGINEGAAMQDSLLILQVLINGLHLAGV